MSPGPTLPLPLPVLKLQRVLFVAKAHRTAAGSAGAFCCQPRSPPAAETPWQAPESQGQGLRRHLAGPDGTAELRVSLHGQVRGLQGCGETPAEQALAAGYQMAAHGQWDPAAAHRTHGGGASDGGCVLLPEGRGKPHTVFSGTPRAGEAQVCPGALSRAREASAAEPGAALRRASRLPPASRGPR